MNAHTDLMRTDARFRAMAKDVPVRPMSKKTKGMFEIWVVLYEGQFKAIFDTQADADDYASTFLIAGKVEIVEGYFDGWWRPGMEEVK